MEIMTPESDKPLQLDLSEIIKGRAGTKGKWIPGGVLRALERVIHQDELNEMLRVAHPHTGSAFSEKILEFLEIKVETEGLESLPAADGSPLVFASNHPLGGLDGIALVAVLGAHYGDDNIRVMVNDLLMNVTPLSGVFLPINKYGKQGARESSRLLNESMEKGRHIVMFPAGLVSRLHPGKEIRDLQWKKTFVSKAIEFGREIVPVRFEGQNSMRFYRTAAWRKKLGLKINIEQALLPGEVCRSRGKAFKIKFGKKINPADLKAAGLTVSEIVERVYREVYSTKPGE